MDFGLYVIITEPLLPYGKVAEICVKHNIKFLQLREKEKDDRELLKIAREIKSITKDSETKFIINDRADICLLSDADGLHLGQEDISFEEAKQILPKDKIVGISTHNLEQVKKAAISPAGNAGILPTGNAGILPASSINAGKMPAFPEDKMPTLLPDYIGFGPIYKTPTKKRPDPVVGCELLRQILTISQIPVVAIGGIDENNILEVLKAGAKNVCMVRDLMKTIDFEKKIIKINDIIRSYI